MIELTEHQSEALASDDIMPTRAVDPRTLTTYVLLPPTAELLAGVTPENLHAEWANGPPLGAELP